MGDRRFLAKMNPLYVILGFILVSMLARSVNSSVLSVVPFEETNLANEKGRCRSRFIVNRGFLAWRLSGSAAFPKVRGSFSGAFDPSCIGAALCPAASAGSAFHDENVRRSHDRIAPQRPASASASALLTGHLLARD